MFTKEDGKLVETVEQPILKIEHSKESLQADLEASIARRDVKQMELDGAEQEVQRFKDLLAKCDELGVVEAAVEEITVSEISK